MEKIDKIAFVHFGKCAGIYTANYLEERVLPDYKLYNSWLKRLPETYKGRDWSEDELLEIAEVGKGPCYVHNHHISWTKRATEAFKKNGWFIFTFLRDPQDLICSLHFWAKKIYKKTGIDPLDCGSHELSLDDFVKKSMVLEDLRKLWVLPDYIDNIDYTSEFTSKNFAFFLKDYFDYDYIPDVRKNTSDNRGYNWYFRKNNISKETDNILTSSDEFKRYRFYL